jgi:hypothetical protein
MNRIVIAMAAAASLAVASTARADSIDFQSLLGAEGSALGSIATGTNTVTFTNAIEAVYGDQAYAFRGDGQVDDQGDSSPFSTAGNIFFTDVLGNSSLGAEVMIGSVPNFGIVVSPITISFLNPVSSLSLLAADIDCAQPDQTTCSANLQERVTAKAFGASDTLLETLTRDWNSGGNGDGSVYKFSFAATGIEKLTLTLTTVTGTSLSAGAVGYDNLEFTTVNNSTPIPEPASLLLLGTGLLMVARLRSRK